MNAMLATLLDPEASEFRITHIEMIKVGAGGEAAGTLPGVEATLCPVGPRQVGGRVAERWRRVGGWCTQSVKSWEVGELITRWQSIACCPPPAGAGTLRNA